MKIIHGKFTPEELQEKITPYIQYLISVSEEGVSLDQAYKYMYAEYVSSMQQQLAFLKLAKKTLKKIKENEKTSD
jgi:hypothetical protein